MRRRSAGTNAKILRLCHEFDTLLLPLVGPCTLNVNAGSTEAWSHLNAGIRAKVLSAAGKTSWDRCWSIWRIWRRNPSVIKAFHGGGITRCAEVANEYHTGAKKRGKSKQTIPAAGEKKLRYDDLHVDLDLNVWFDCAFEQLSRGEDMHPADVQCLLRYMTQNLDSVAGMVDACVVVERVTDGNAGNWIRIANGGGIALVLQALHRHLKHPAVAQRACEALATQSCFVELPMSAFASSKTSKNEEKKNHDAEEEMEEENQENEDEKDNDEKNHETFLALATAVHSPVLIGRLGGIPLLLDVLTCEAHDNSPQVGGAALRALAGLLLGSEDNQRELVRCGGVAVLADWLDCACSWQPEFDAQEEEKEQEEEKKEDQDEEKKEDQDEEEEDKEEKPEDWIEVAVWACWALAQLLAEGCVTETKEVKQGFVLPGLASTLLEAVRVFSSDADVVRQALWALVPLFADDALRGQCIRQIPSGDAFMEQFFDVAGEHDSAAGAEDESLWQIVVVLSKSLDAPMANGEPIGHVFAECVQPWLDENEGTDNEVQENVNRFLGLASGQRQQSRIRC
jgi:hypothetical protein